MESPIEVTEGVDGWNTIIFLYNSALKEVGTKLTEEQTECPG